MVGKASSAIVVDEQNQVKSFGIWWFLYGVQMFTLIQVKYEYIFFVHVFCINISMYVHFLFISPCSVCTNCDFLLRLLHVYTQVSFLYPLSLHYFAKTYSTWAVFHFSTSSCFLSFLWILQAISSLYLREILTQHWRKHNAVMSIEHGWSSHHGWQHCSTSRRKLDPLLLRIISLSYIVGYSI